jgi:hypothetical protein
VKYKLYLDDLRYPDLHPDWRIARNYHDAVWMVTNYGMPYHISFDHDLADVRYDDNWPGPRGKEKSIPYEFTGYDFAKWFCNWVMDNNVDLEPIGFTYHVHSANPVGAENIRCYMANFMKDRFV